MGILSAKPALALISLTACSLLGSDCTLLACFDGLIVHLSTMPVGAFRVEVFLAHPESENSFVYTYNCGTSGGCFQDIQFRDLQVAHVWVRVSTDSGSRTTEHVDLRYEAVHPNGQDCGPECHQATVTVEVPD